MRRDEFKRMMNRMRNQHQFVVGIDPDCDLSGLCIVNRKEKKVDAIGKYSFPELVLMLYRMKDKQDFKVYVEAGWITETNYRIFNAKSAAYASKMGVAIGRNHETGRKIVECLEFLGVEVEAVAPLRKSWRGKDGKITADEFKSVTGVTGRHNQEERDAGLIAWTYANLPVHIKVNNK